jgi:hypothetical protein
VAFLTLLSLFFAMSGSLRKRVNSQSGLVLLALFLGSGGLIAQDLRGSITGIVHDAQGAVLPGAKITLTNVDTQEQQTAVTGGDGSYRLPSLKAGNYELRIEAAGFATSVRTNVTVSAAQQLVFDETMQVGQVAQVVSVNAQTLQVSTTDASVGQVIDEQRVADLPLNGRNYVNLTLLAPGVQQNVIPTGGGTGAAGTWFSSNGIPARSNMFYIDGTVMNNAFWTGANSEAGATLGVDGIKEFKTVTSTFGPEYAYTAGAQMVIVSKGGTNNWHGDVFEYIRNNHLDARNYFDPAPSLLNGQRLPQFKRNNFGASIGGPIQKDKTFAFLVYEGLRSAQGDTIQDTTLPAACHMLTATPGGVGELDLAEQNPIFPGGAYLAQPAACASGLTSTTKVPAVIQPWIGQFPLPNEPTLFGGLGFTFPANTVVREDYAQGRIDHAFTATDNSFARYTFDDSHITDPYAQLNVSDNGTAYPQFSVLGHSRNQWVTLSETHVFNPAMVGTTHVSFSRTVFVADNVYNTTSLNPFGQLIGPQWSIITGFTNGGMSPGSGTTSLGPATTYLTYHFQNILSISHDLYYTKGKHNLKFGFLLSNFQNSLLQLRGAYGSVGFANLAGFMQGTITSYNGVTQDPDMPPTTGFYLDRMFNWHTAGFYASDEWHMTPRLTVNYGARYEFMANFHEHQGRSSTIPNIATSDTYRIGSVIDNPTFKNFAPRIGLAWDVLGNGSLAIRSGFGLYYDVGNIGGLLTQSPQGVPPFSLSTTYTNASGFPLVLPTASVLNSSEIGKSLQMNDYNEKSPHYLQYNLAIEKRLASNATLAVSYVGMHGIDLYDVQEGNPVKPMGYASNGYPVFNVANGQAGCMNNALTLGVTPTFPAAAYPCRVNPYWTAVIFIPTRSSASFNSLQILETTRIGRSLNLAGSFVWARDLDTTIGQMNGTECGTSGGPGPGQFPLNLKLDRGPGCSDIKDASHITLIYNLPRTQNSLLGKFANGWWVSTIATLQGGLPFAVTSSTQRSYDGVSTAGDRLDVVSGGGPGTGKAVGQTFVPFNHNKVIEHKVNQWYNPYMFSLNALGIA